MTLLFFLPPRFLSLFQLACPSTTSRVYLSLPWFDRKSDAALLGFKCVTGGGEDLIGIGEMNIVHVARVFLSRESSPANLISHRPNPPRRS